MLRSQEKLEKIGALEQVQLGVWAVGVSNGYDMKRGLLRVDDFCLDDPGVYLI